MLCPAASHKYHKTDSQNNIRDGLDPLECPDTCLYCHTLDEFHFHPLNYKTRLCDSLMVDGGESPCCVGGDTAYCPFAHSRDEIRLSKFNFNGSPETKGKE
jgi:hypothetical protein